MADLNSTLKLLKQQSVMPGSLLALSNLDIIDLAAGRSWYMDSGNTVVSSLVAVFDSNESRNLCDAIRYTIPVKRQKVAILAISVIDCYNLQLHFIESVFKLPKHHLTGFEDCRSSRTTFLKPGNIYYALVVESRMVDGSLRVLL